MLGIQARSLCSHSKHFTHRAISPDLTDTMASKQWKNAAYERGQGHRKMSLLGAFLVVYDDVKDKAMQHISVYESPFARRTLLWALLADSHSSLWLLVLCEARWNHFLLIRAGKQRVRP